MVETKKREQYTDVQLQDWYYSLDKDDWLVIEFLTDRVESPLPQFGQNILQQHRKQVIQRYMNLRKTEGYSESQYKSELNKSMADFYVKSMFKYKIPIPSEEVCDIMGDFNGEGTF